MGTSSIVNTFPHANVNVIDKSIYNPVYREELPLHRPIYFSRAMKGLVGVPAWCGTYDYAKWMYGEGTFDKYAKWYSRESVFMKQLFTRAGGCFIVRLASDQAKTASSTLSMKVTPANITQYKKDEYGQFITDTDGNRIAKTDDTGNPITEPGYKIQWLKGVIPDSTDINALKVTTVEENGVSTQTFPVLAHQAISPGEYGNDLGYKLDFDPDNMDSAQVSRIGALEYRYWAMNKTYAQDTVSPVSTAYGAPNILVAMRSDAQDKNMDQNYALTDRLDRLYFSNSMQLSKLPFSVYMYDAYYKVVATAVLNAETSMTETNPFMIDLFTGRKSDGTYLDHVEIVNDVTNTNSVVISEDYVIYLSGGDDGDITDTAIETLTRQWLKDDIYPDISDYARFPFTHMYDTGVSLDTKKAMLSFLAVRDDFKAILTTQDCNASRMNYKDEDMSVGMSLHAAALLQPESTVYGTECCRVEIYQQAGYLIDTTNYTGFLPLTLEAMDKRAQYQSVRYLRGLQKGIPGSQIQLFNITKLNWKPCKVDQKQDSWDYGLNYCQHYDRTRMHWPDIRTVYRFDTSVLSSATFTDAVIYTKYIARYNWALHAGKELPFELLATAARRTTLKDMQFMLNGIYGVAVEFYRTADEKKIGYITHGTISLTGHASNRIWDVDVVCYRSDYTPEEA